MLILNVYLGPLLGKEALIMCLTASSMIVFHSFATVQGQVSM